MTSQIAFDLGQGQQDKHVGLESVSRNNDWFLEMMRAEARRLSKTKGRVSSDDLRAYAANEGIEPAHSNAWGAIFAESGWIVIGHVRSRLVSNHGREIKVWKWFQNA